MRWDVRASGGGPRGDPGPQAWAALPQDGESEVGMPWSTRAQGVPHTGVSPGKGSESPSGA